MTEECDILDSGGFVGCDREPEITPVQQTEPPDFTGKDRGCACPVPTICDLLAELKAMKDRINQMIISVQNVPGDGAGNVHLPFSEDVEDALMARTGTFAGGRAVLQVNDKAATASADSSRALSAASSAHDAAVLAEQAANRAESRADHAVTVADAIAGTAQDAQEQAVQAKSTADRAEAAATSIRPSTRFNDATRTLTVEVNGSESSAVIPGGGSAGVEDVQVSQDADSADITIVKDGVPTTQSITAVSATAAGVITPVQYSEISDGLDALGTAVNDKATKASVTEAANAAAAAQSAADTAKNWARTAIYNTQTNLEAINGKASQTDLDSLDARVTSAEDDLLHKVSDTELTALSDRVTANTEALGLKAGTDTVNALDVRVTANTEALATKASNDALNGKADKNTVVDLTSNQTIGGVKTWTNTIKIDSEIIDKMVSMTNEDREQMPLSPRYKQLGRFGFVDNKNKNLFTTTLESTSTALSSSILLAANIGNGLKTSKLRTIIPKTGDPYIEITPTPLSAPNNAAVSKGYLMSVLQAAGVNVNPQRLEAAYAPVRAEGLRMMAAESPEQGQDLQLQAEPVKAAPVIMTPRRPSEQIIGDDEVIL